MATESLPNNDDEFGEIDYDDMDEPNEAVQPSATTTTKSMFTFFFYIIHANNLKINIFAASITTTATAAIPAEPHLIQLPLSRIKEIMKLDPDLKIAAPESVFAIAKATELFIQSLALESCERTSKDHRKTLQKSDLDVAISSVDALLFLDGAIDVFNDVAPTNVEQ